MPIRRLILGVLLLVCGFVAGLVLTGRMRALSSDAEGQAAAPRPQIGATAAATGSLPDFTAVAQRLGGKALARVGGPSGAYVATVLGVLLILGPVLLGRLVSFGGTPLWFVATPLSAIGFLAEYAAWTVGFGAAVFVAFGNSPRLVPPPLP